MGTKLRLFVVAAVGAALLAGCFTPADISSQNDLKSGLAAENQIRTTTGQYTSRLADLKQVAPSLDWGGKLRAVVGDAQNAGDEGVVCLDEPATTGTMWSIAQVAIGADAGVYYGKAACPAAPTPANLRALGTVWTP